MRRLKLTPIELSFWYQYKYNTASDANLIIHRLTLHSSYDLGVIQNAIQQLVIGHPILGSRFIEEHGDVWRIESNTIHPKVIDAFGMSDSQIEKVVHAPFSLEDDSLLRVLCAKKGNSTVLYICVPHIIFDGSSWDILLSDLCSLLSGKSIPVGRSNDYPTTSHADGLYWQERLESTSGLIELEEKKLPQFSTASLGIRAFDDKENILNNLKNIGQTYGIPMNTLCLSVLAITLHKFTEAELITIGTPVNMRDEISLNAIGAYINVLPILFNVDKNIRFIDFAKQHSLRIWDDIDHRHFSLIELASTIGLGSHSGNQSIYNILAEYVPFKDVAQPVIKNDELLSNNNAKMDIMLSVHATSKHHSIVIEYDRCKFETTYINTLMSLFMSICRQLVENPNLTIRQMSLLDTNQALAVINLGKGPVKELKPPYIWNRFRDAALSYPDNIAIKTDTEHFTYADLLKMVSSYAAYFEKCGVRIGSVVGIHGGRDSTFVASMLALWSLGAIYVPLDNHLPKERIAQMIKQANITYIVAKHDGHDLKGATIINPDNSDKNITRDSTYEPKGADLAYIIFTSGSTGTPKGVMIKHEGFLNHLLIMIDTFHLNAEDVVAQTAPVSFDISVWQLVCALCVGGTIRIITHDCLINPDEALKIFKDDSVTILEIVPSLLNGYLESDTRSNTPEKSLHNISVITTGEAIHSPIAALWCSQYPGKPLYNAYGPAEASDDTHFYEITSTTQNGTAPIPIGRPLLNIRTYIVTADLQLCPQGMIGEICIGGISVAEGYVGDSSLTDASFIADPFSEQVGSRMYRTGDYGRWTSEGLLEYHGRRDHQVKIRGQRMELGDVENCLRGLKGVSDVAVIAKKSSTSTRLIGYITLSNPNIKTDLLKDELRKYLPEYMIPWKLIAISALPRNVNGKLDRKALESKRIRTVESQTTSTLAHDSQDLSSIISTYSEVLGVDITGRSNYFECGGDSLSSMRIVSQLNTMGIPVGIRDILLYQTPLELHAYLMRGKTRTGTHSPLQGYNPMQSHYCSNLMQSEIANSEIQAASFQLPATAKVTTSDVTEALISIMRAHTEFECGYPHPSPLVYNLSTKASAEDYYKIVEDGRQLITLQHPLIAYLSGSNTIVLIASHLVTDYYSWDTIRTELVGLLERSIRQIPTDSSLALWWGNKLKELKEDPSLLGEAASYWTEPVTPIKKRHQAPTYSSTLQSSFTIEIAPSLLADMQSKNISTESLGIYLLVYSQLSANSEDTFSCMIESSLRSIDDEGALQNGVGWMTYLFPKEYTSTSLQHSTLLNFHNNLAYALKHGYQYGLLRYNLQPRAKARNNILWTINYLGETIQANSELSIIRTLPLRKKPFIEVEIHYHAGTLIYDFMYNHLLSAEFLALSKTLMEERIRALELSISAKSLATPLDSKRRKSILERLRDASQH